MCMKSNGNKTLFTYSWEKVQIISEGEGEGVLGLHALDLFLLLFHRYHFTTLEFSLYYIYLFLSLISLHITHQMKSTTISFPLISILTLMVTHNTLQFLLTPILTLMTTLFEEDVFTFLKKVLLWYPKTLFIHYLFFTTNKMRTCEKYHNN